jgi:pimeloyl-ACP methyl ester carboxylesterase
MAYQENGTGMPLVLVHGAMNDYRCWNFQIPVFAAHYRVIAVSLRHYFPNRGTGIATTFRSSSMPTMSPSSRERSILDLSIYSGIRAEARLCCTSLRVTSGDQDIGP